MTDDGGWATTRPTMTDDEIDEDRRRLSADDRGRAPRTPAPPYFFYLPVDSDLNTILHRQSPSQNILMFDKNFTKF